LNYLCLFSDNLRAALGIAHNQLPPYIYQMRHLGYPPGHLEDARQQTSGLSMFGKHGLGKGCRLPASTS
jgi:zinc finger CCHC domain-containing protein 8